MVCLGAVNPKAFGLFSFGYLIEMYFFESDFIHFLFSYEYWKGLLLNVYTSVGYMQMFFLLTLNEAKIWQGFWLSEQHTHYVKTHNVPPYVTVFVISYKPINQ